MFFDDQFSTNKLTEGSDIFDGAITSIGHEMKNNDNSCIVVLASNIACCGSVIKIYSTCQIL